jgi:hypothetical protein
MRWAPPEAAGVADAMIEAGFLREAREKCLSTGQYLSQVLDFIEMVSGLI